MIHVLDQESSSNSATLSSNVWQIKTKQKETPSLTWETIRPIPAYSNITKQCLLYLHKKLLIATYPNPSELLKIWNSFQNAACKNFNSNDWVNYRELIQAF